MPARISSAGLSGAEERVPLEAAEELGQGHVGELEEAPRLAGEHHDDGRRDQDREAGGERQRPYDHLFADPAGSHRLRAPERRQIAPERVRVEGVGLQAAHEDRQSTRGSRRSVSD